MRTRKTARRDKVEVYWHLIWTTWDRQPFISPAWEANLYGIFHEILERHGCGLVAVGGVTDHVHLLVRSHATTRLCDVVKDLKGTSSRFASGQCEGFKWRPTYAAFSVSRWDVDKLQTYIRGQKEHHQSGTTKAALETFDEEYEYEKSE